MADRGKARVASVQTFENNYRIDHYYSLEGDGEIEEGHIFCTPEEGTEISVALRAAMPVHVMVVVEAGGEYDYTTEGATAEQIAQSIISDSGFVEQPLTLAQELMVAADEGHRRTTPPAKRIWDPSEPDEVIGDD